MKYGKIIGIIGLFFTIFIGCASSSSSNAVNLPRGTYYTGEGGKGMSLAILVPKATGLVENQNYITALVQGEFVSNFSGYSAISVLDRERLDEQYAELLSGYYDDDAEAGLDLGHLTPTEYIMGGTITKTATGYALQIQITKTADKMTAASYSGTCTFAELDNLIGIRRVSLDLLQKMGIALTERARTELIGAVATNHVNGQTALAQGITAQRGGTVVEAMSYYYEAARFDPSLREAVNRLSAVSSNVRTGNIGLDARNRIADRDAWVSILQQCGVYYLNHLPIEIRYNPQLTHTNLNYQKRTVDLQFNVSIYASDNIQMMQDILTGLRRTGKMKEWGLEDGRHSWPFLEDHPRRYFGDFYHRPINPSEPKFVLNKDYYPSYIRNLGMGLSSIEDDIYKIDIRRSVTPAGKIDNGLLWMEFGADGPCLETHLNFSLVNEQEKTISQLGNFSINPIKVTGNRILISTQKGTVTFTNVLAEDITDNLTIRIVSVNGIPAEEATQSGYVRIVSQ
jgi:hypothetical protein